MELWRSQAFKECKESGRAKCSRNEGKSEWLSEPDAPEQSNKTGLNKEEKDVSRVVEAEARLQWASPRSLDCEGEEITKARRGLCVKEGFCGRYLFKFPGGGEEIERERLKLQERERTWWNNKQYGS